MADDETPAGAGGGTRQSKGTNESPPDGAQGIRDLAADASIGAARLTVAIGTSFYEPDAPAKSLYLIHEGQVRIFQVASRQSAQLVEILGPGDWFGIPALAAGATSASGASGATGASSAPAVYGMRAVAVTAATVSQAPADRLMAALPHQPSVARELIVQLAGKLQDAYNHAANLVFDDTEKRLIKALLQFSRTAAASPLRPEAGGEGGVELRITHQQLAQAVGAARETVSLTLTHLRQRNLLRTGRNRLSFNPQVLEDFARAADEPSATPEPEPSPPSQPPAA